MTYNVFGGTLSLTQSINLSTVIGAYCKSSWRYDSFGMCLTCLIMWWSRIFLNLVFHCKLSQPTLIPVNCWLLRWIWMQS